MSWSKADAEYQRAKGHATSAQIEERKTLDLRYLRYPAKDWIGAICAIQQNDWIAAICAIHQKTGLALSALTSKKKTGFALSALSSKRRDVRSLRYPAKED